MPARHCCLLRTGLGQLRLVRLSLTLGLINKHVKLLLTSLSNLLYSVRIHTTHRQHIKLGTHHATFVGTTIVVCGDDGRRSSNDPHTPCDDRRMTAHTTRRQLAAHTTADNS